MKLRKLLAWRVNSWLHLAKGAGRALALTEGLLVVVLFAVVLNLFNTAPTSATYINLSTSSNAVNIPIPAAYRVAYATHDVATTSDVANGFQTVLSSASEQTSMVNERGETIASVTSRTPLTDKTFGVKLVVPSSDADAITTNWDPLVPLSSTNKKLITESNTAQPNGLTNTVAYGVRFDNPDSLKSGTFKIEVQYTATAKLPADPIIDYVSPNTYELCDDCSSKITIKGSHLSTITNIYIDINNNDKMDEGEQCKDLTMEGGYEITCYVPTLKDNPNIPKETATYDVVIEAESENGGVILPDYEGFTYTYSPIPDSKSVSANYGNAGHVTVDYDENMIPVVYDETNKAWKSLSDAEQQTANNWFNYTDGKKWANAVTVQKGKLDTYKGKSATVQSDDILGYWVYIPRYAYEVQRRDATDKFVTAQDFNVKFETKDDFKKSPKAGCTTSEMLVADINSARDYRTECGIDRTYPTNETNANNTTWATHPAFTWTYTNDVNGFDKTIELNGIWVGKFETTGSTTKPTIKPNQKHLASQYIGAYYDIAKSVGRLDCDNGYGNDTSTDQNTHNLASSKTHMLKNSEWGVVTYLSASQYGSSVNKTYKNGNYQSGTDQNGKSSYGVTGCGPSGTTASPGTGNYSDGEPLDRNNYENVSACSKSIDRSYTSEIGQLASTTNNIYGIYDMAGGAWEYVMGNRTAKESETTASPDWPDAMMIAARTPYVNLYKVSDGFGFTDVAYNKPSWSNGRDEDNWNNDVCTWVTCGGQALHETKTAQSVSSSYGSSWGSGYSYFGNRSYPWFLRGDDTVYGSYAGPFYAVRSNGYGYANSGFRVSLLALPSV